MRNSVRLSIFIFLVLAISSCRKDNTMSTRVTDGPEVNTTVFATVAGYVTDISTNILEGALVQLGDEIVTTDEDGFFYISAVVDSVRTMLQITQNGYFNSYRTLVPNLEEITRVHIRMMEKLNPIGIDAQTGGEITVPFGGNLNFPSNAFTDDSGNPYNGTVNIYSSYIDPNELMHKNEMGLDLNEAEKALEVFNMIVFELEGNNGQQLQLNQPVEIKFSSVWNGGLPPPNFVPLWYYDIETGLWTEDGQAELVNDVYEGLVNNPFAWITAVPHETVKLTGKVQYFDRDPEVTIKISDSNSVWFRQVKVNYKGGFQIEVGTNREFNLKAINECENVLRETTIAPLSSDTNLGTIELVDGFVPNWVEISGTIEDCSENPIEEGFLILKTEQPNRLYSIFLEENETVLGYLPACGPVEVLIKAIDTNSSQTSELLTFPIISTIDLGNIKACN